MNLERPATSEYAPYAKAYIDLVEGSDIVSALTTQQEDAAALIGSFDDRHAGQFVYAPGKWTLKQVINHIIDTERVFAYRALCLARNDLRPLPGFDQDEYVRFGPASQCTIADLREEFTAVRAATIALFRNLPDEAWLRRGSVNEYDVTIRGLAFHIAGHERHHVKIVREKYLAAALRQGI